VSRLFAALYDPVMTRDRRLRAARAELLREASGRILEIGAGTGLNAPYYPVGSDVTYTEPDPHMARRAPVDVVVAPAESLPFADATFDTVVSTLVLCTVGDPDTAMGEIRRVLRPGGRLLLLEHVRAADGSRLAGWQDRVNPVWRRVAGGCNCNRDTVAALARSGFTVRLRPSGFAPPLIRPVLVGEASVDTAAGIE
jgi:SAM-dependent methyltransferase